MSIREFKYMADYLHQGVGVPLSKAFSYPYGKGMYWRNYPDFSFILVYLEDYVKKADNSYTLLIDFFTVYDYLRFEEFFHGEQTENEEKEPPHSSFIKVDNYISQDAPIKDTHYFLDLNMLKGRMVSMESGGIEGFSILYNMVLQKELEDGNAPLMYLAGSMVYPQWVFRSLQQVVPFPTFASNNLELMVYDVWQGNFNEIKEGDCARLVFDAGTELLDGTVPFLSVLGKLQKELTNRLPLFVLSHWHTDHYSLLFALTNAELKRIQGFVFPSFVRNLSVFLFLLRLRIAGCNVTMINLPYSTPWVAHIQNGSAMKLYANKYVKSNTNNSGLTVFVEGATNNVMLAGDCRYRIVESQANDAIRNTMHNGQTHYLVVPHHGGLAGKVSYQISNAQSVDGIVSVGARNRHKHPNRGVLGQLGVFLRSIDRTDVSGDVIKKL